LLLLLLLLLSLVTRLLTNAHPSRIALLLHRAPADLPRATRPATEMSRRGTTQYTTCL
jgi:hypothetical protein